MTTNPLRYELKNAVLQKDCAQAANLLTSHPELITLRNSFEETVLHFLAVENDQEGVQWLYSLGFSLNIRTDFGDPMLFEIASPG